jgi:membrane protease YdiL (CAAX protease family)
MNEQGCDVRRQIQLDALANHPARIGKLERAAALLPNAAIAAAVVSAVVATEYVFRHYVLFWMPTLGTLRVNDMVALGMAYSLLLITVGSLAHANWRQELRDLGRALREFVTQWAYTPWLLVLMLSLVVLPPVDQWLLGGLRFPMLVSAFRNSDIWFAHAALALQVLAVIGVNGFFVPIAEEYLWRGIIQARLSQALPATVAIAVTAVLFSLKHVAVDASWGRFLTLVAFGSICGLLAQRHTWRSSAALHLVVNTAASTVALAVGKMA